MYLDPLTNRYADKKIVEIFSDTNRYSTWRKLWFVLAKAESELGLNISAEQLKQMEDNIYNIDFSVVSELEETLQHDVMAHLHAFALVAPLAKPIIHLGATSEFVKDNTDLIMIRDALIIIQSKLQELIKELSIFALKYKNMPTIAFTHYQVAQPTTVGRRACLWIHSLLMDYNNLVHFQQNLKFRSIKGTTGTLASFKELFNDFNKVKQLDTHITHYFGFQESFSITGQTYDRKVDVSVLNVLSQIGISAHKFTNDIRLLQNLKELEESFGESQVGSSAMPYKRNPIKCERVSSLAKYLMSLPVSATMVASTQWLERTLDDSANRRITLPQGFFAVSGILNLLIDIVKNLQVNEKVIHKNLMQEIPFLATENIMMLLVKKGQDRQEVHEKIRKYSIEAKRKIIELGQPNDLLDNILKDTSFGITKKEIENIVNINNFIGFATEQTEDFIHNEVYKIIKE